MRAIPLFMSGVMLATPLAAETIHAVRCEYPTIPTVTIYYGKDTTTGTAGVFSVADLRPAPFPGGMGSTRIESGEIAGYHFQWAPANNVMDVSDAEGNLIISEEGRCDGADMNGKTAKLSILPKSDLPKSDEISDIHCKTIKKLIGDVTEMLKVTLDEFNDTCGRQAADAVLYELKTGKRLPIVESKECASVSRIFESRVDLNQDIISILDACKGK